MVNATLNPIIFLTRSVKIRRFAREYCIRIISGRYKNPKRPPSYRIAFRVTTNDSTHTTTHNVSGTVQHVQTVGKATYARVRKFSAVAERECQRIMVERMGHVIRSRPVTMVTSVSEV